MKIENTTDVPSQVIRRCVSWICGLKGIGYADAKIRPSDIKTVKVMNTRHGWHGHAKPWSKEVLLRFAKTDEAARTGTAEEMAALGSVRGPRDRWEALVSIAAHEVQHLAHDYRGRINGASIRRSLKEGESREAERIALVAFRADRDNLLERWHLGVARDLRPTEERVALARMVAVKLREDKARASLASWERKLKTAQRKVKEYRAKVRYYDKKTSDRKIDLG
jgi:hypothetical protein